MKALINFYLAITWEIFELPQGYWLCLQPGEDCSTLVMPGSYRGWNICLEKCTYFHFCSLLFKNYFLDVARFPPFEELILQKLAVLALERFIFPATAWISRTGLFYRKIHLADSFGLAWVQPHQT